MTVSGAAPAVRAAGVGELVWVAPDGVPRAYGVVPLLLDGRPAVALPWALEAVAREAAASPSVALVLAEPRMAGPGFTALAMVGAPELVADADGDLVVDRLLDEELRKHPPSRALADSPLLRREHWWYLPRLVLLLDAAAHVVPLAPRRSPADATLAVAAPGGLAVATVTVEDWDADPVPVAPVPAPGGATEPAAPRQPEGRLPDGPAALVGQELSVPDVERWTVHVTRGSLTAGRLAVTERPATRALEPVPGLLARVRRQRALERGCVRALKAHRR